MNRLLTGMLLGLVIASLAGAGLWAAGLAVFGPVGPSTGGAEESGLQMSGTTPAEDEHAGHDMAAMAPAEDEHAGHDMAAMAPAEDEHAGHDMDAMTEPEEDAAAMPANAVMISPERQQLIGVRTAAATIEDVSRTVRTVGRVEYDETRVSHVHTRVSGWIQSLYVDFTGKHVEQGQPLIGIYSPELVATQEEYLLALRAQSSLGTSEYAEIALPTRALLDSTRRRLQLWSVTDEQIAAIEASGEPQTELMIHAPVSGVVIHKNAYEGLHVDPGTELYTIADLSEVWVIADVYESELPYVREGQRGTVSLSHQPGSSFRGVVDYVYPYLADDTRIVSVRLVLPNPDAMLKPGMFANVELQANLGRSVVIPEDAVIDTGERQVVFLILDEGHFLPREVVTGMRFDGKLQVLSGLSEGDVVAAGAAFLIDSESKLGSALRGMSGHQH